MQVEVSKGIYVCVRMSPMAPRCYHQKAIVAGTLFCRLVEVVFDRE